MSPLPNPQPRRNAEPLSEDRCGVGRARAARLAVFGHSQDMPTPLPNSGAAGTYL